MLLRYIVPVSITVAIVCGACQRKASTLQDQQSGAASAHGQNVAATVISAIIECTADTAWVGYATKTPGYLKSKGWKRQIEPGVIGSIIVTLKSALGDTLAMKRFENPLIEHVEAPLLPDAPGTQVVIERDTASFHVRTSLPVESLTVAEDQGTGFKALTSSIQILAILQEE